MIGRNADTFCGSGGTGGTRLLDALVDRFAWWLWCDLIALRAGTGAGLGADLGFAVSSREAACGCSMTAEILG